MLPNESFFQEKYARDFQLFTSEHLIEQGVFGERGSMGYLLGDYIALGTYTHKIALLTPHSKRFKGHHTAMTEEMEVPLILLET